MSKLIVKHNNFVEANYYLTPTEVKIIARLSSMIQKEDETFKSYRFSLKELLIDLELGEENYTNLIDSLDRLLTRIIVLKKVESNSFLKTTFLSSTEYFLDDSSVELSFDEKLRPYLLQLKNNFTMYQFKNVIALNSFYAIRIYELCKQYQTIKERTIELKELKKILNIEKKYKLYADFKRRVLKIAEREINEKTDINIRFDEIKIGRKVTSLKFLIEKSKTKKITARQKSFDEILVPQNKNSKIKDNKKKNILKQMIENPTKNDLNDFEVEWKKTKPFIKNSTKEDTFRIWIEDKYRDKLQGGC